MKKDIEWLKREIEEYIEPYEEEDYLSYSAGCTDVAEIILELIDQLDEPEVLSQEWIDDNKKYSSVHSIGYYVPIGRLHDLLVPKLEEQEPETVASVIADFYKSLERLKEVLGTEVEELEE